MNSRTDVRLYRENFDAICRVVAETLAGRAIAGDTPGSVTPEELDILRRIVWAEAALFSFRKIPRDELRDFLP